MDCLSFGGFPPGFRFHPSDQELILHYLHNKVTSHPLPAHVIADIDLYKYNPWELPKKALSFGEDEWYFFSPRDRKYPNGARPNRAAASGYWKATGTDKPILAFGGSKNIGVKKSLVFYGGRPPKGIKTDWIMNEYRLPDSMIKPSRRKGSMRLDDWVLCRVRHKGSMPMYAGDDQQSEHNFGGFPSYVLPEMETTVGTPLVHRRVENRSIVDHQSKDFQRMVSLITGKSRVHATEIITSFSVQGSNNGSDENAVTNPIYENTLKRSAPEDNRNEEGFLHQPRKKQYIDSSDEDLLSKVLGECGGLEQQCNQQKQCQNYSFNLQTSDSIIDFQALNDLTFQ